MTNYQLNGACATGVLVLFLTGACLAQQTIHAPRGDGAQTSLKIYTPKSPGCAPLALISPGAGGTQDGYSYLAEGLRDHGWLAVVMGHKESGPKQLRGDMWHAGIHGGIQEMVFDPVLHHDRDMDVTAALQWAEKGCHRPFKALLGHSMGSDTVMFEAGARNKMGIRGRDRFDAYVAISPSGTGSIFPENAWSGIRKPLYVLTGTRDKGLEGSWQWRTEPFASLPSGCKWLGVINGATHLNFAGIGFAGKTKKLTLDTVNAFLNGARSGNCVAPPVPQGMQLEGK